MSRRLILNVFPKLQGIKRRGNERKAVFYHDTHFFSLPQNAKIGFKSFATDLNVHGVPWRLCGKN